MNNKAELGFDTVKAFMIGILIVGVIGIASILALITIGDAVGRTETITGTRVINETLILNTSGNNILYYQLRGITLSNVVLYNGSGVVNINSANYTVSGGRITAVATSVYGNQTVKASYDYTHISDSDVGDVSNNYTTGVGKFIRNIPTVFVLLGVMVLVLIIVLVILYVQRFAGGQAVL